MIEKLMMYGLSRQEAVIYICLLKNAELTGYEVAKLTGISRSNIYNGLTALVDNGAAYVAEGNPSKYIAVDLEEFCDNRLRQLEDVREYLIQNCPKAVTTSEGYITIEGERHICDKIHHMIQNTEKRIYFSACSSFLENWSAELTELVKNQRKVVLITEQVPIFIENSQELKEKMIIHLKPSKEEDSQQVRLIIDSEYVLTGEVSGRSSDTCLYSAQKNFVNVFKDAMRNEIELIQIKGKARKEKNED